MITLRLLACLAVFAPAAASAANYRHPYTNVDPRTDAGNDTGDAVVDQLNDLQLRRPGSPVPVYPNYARVVPPPVYYAPPRYYTPPAGYVVAPAYPAYGYGW